MSEITNGVSVKSMSVTDIVNTYYKDFWKYNNKGKNAFLPEEQLIDVVKKIIYSSYELNIRERVESKLTSLTGQVVKIHPHGDESISESIKGCASKQKSQPATRLLEGIGNFGDLSGDLGAQARYLFIAGTPIMSAIYKDIPFMDIVEDEEGNKYPNYISTPLPFTLINGTALIGTGKSSYLDEKGLSV